MSKVRLNWTMNEFYADGGTTRFADRIAAALGIHASTIKVVAVYKGSVVVEFFVTTEDDDSNPTKTLTELSSKLSDKLAKGQISLGAPILNAYTGGENVDVPLPKGTTKAPAFKRPAGTEAKPKVKEYIKKGEDFEWGDKKNEQFAVSQVVVGTAADDAEAKVDDNKAKVPILILVIVLAILVTIVAVIAIRFCILASQKAKLTSIKKSEARAEAELEPQLDERDFDDIFA